MDIRGVLPGTQEDKAWCMQRNFLGMRMMRCLAGGDEGDAGQVVRDPCLQEILSFILQIKTMRGPLFHPSEGFVVSLWDCFL